MRKKLIWTLSIVATIITVSLYFSSLSFTVLESAIIYESSDLLEINEEVKVESVIVEGGKHISLHRPVFGLAHIDEQLENFLVNRLALFDQALSYDNRDIEVPDIVVDYKIVYRSPKHVSVLFFESKNNPLVRDSEQIFAFNFNIQSQKLLTLADLFNDENLLLHTLYQYTQHRITSGAIPEVALDHTVTMAIAPIYQNYRNFTLGDEEITFYISRENSYFPVPIPYRDIGQHVELLQPVSSGIYREEPVAVVLRPPIPRISLPDLGGSKVSILLEDGPHFEITEKLLDILYDKQVRATFAPLGIRAAEFEELVRRIAREGHEVENHGWSKPLYSRADLEEDYAKAQALLLRFGIEPKKYIIPGAGLPPHIGRSIPLPIITQTLDLSTKKYLDPDRFVQEVLSSVRDRDIIRLFDADEYTVELLPKLIDALHAAGYKIAPVGDIHR